VLYQRRTIEEKLRVVARDIPMVPNGRTKRRSKNMDSRLKLLKMTEEMDISLFFRKKLLSL